MGTVTILPELASQARTWTMPGPDGWTVDDLPELGEGLRYELVDGCLVVSPMQPPAHNGAAFELGYRLRQVLTREWAVTVPGGIQFDQRNWREPDLMVLRRAALGEKTAGPGDVLLAVEVMSPSSVTRDRRTKPAQYAEAGIPHFWRLERRPGLLLVTYALAGDTYRETGRFDEEVVVTEPVALRFAVDELC